MDKNPTMATAKFDVISDKIDKQMCQVYHNEVMKKFSRESETEEITLPSALQHLSEQRSHIVKVADVMGVNVSTSKDKNLILSKEADRLINKYNFLQLSSTTESYLIQSVKKPQLDSSAHSLHGRPERHNRSCDGQYVGNGNCRAGRLTISEHIPTVPMFFGERAELVRYRRSLPIYQHRQEILDLVSQQQVVVIAGDIGCGKTTQVPQYIVEHAFMNRLPCRVVSIQPRRISALAAADRVTEERGVTGEKVVGFHVRLESRGLTNCPLTFCTTGVFLRTLMEGHQCLKGLTHIIVDQVNDRDRHTDLLLGVLRLRLNQYPNLRLILLSTNVAPHHLASYFHQEKIVRVAVPCNPVSEFFLEDILTCTNFLTKQNILMGAGSAVTSPTALGGASVPVGPAMHLDELITKAWFDGSDAVFHQLMKDVDRGFMSVDYQHSQTGITLLMASAIHGKIDVVKAAISSGANPTLQVRGMTAYDLANEFARPEVADLLATYGEVFNKELGQLINCAELSVSGGMNQNSPDDMLKSFYSKYSKDHANLDLIIEVLSFVQGYSQAGAILVFLPAYSEVVELRDMIATSTSALREKLEVHTLHGHLRIVDFKKLFLPAAAGKRKVILTTNIAETSMYFEDVACVIDSGLVRDRETDVVYTNPGKTRWITKSSAAQRALHVRNGGLIFHLYPRSRWEGLQEFVIPEITRDPLVDVCLYARVIIPEEMRLPQFFCTLPDSPPTSTIHKAVEILQAIDALDSQIKVTEVGRQLLALPVEPRLAKMVLVATVLRCLDPVVTIASCLARDDPFITPPSPEDRKMAMARKFELVADNLSDHLALLKAYHFWEKNTDEVRKRQICQENYVSLPILETIFLLRVLLVGELRASGYIRSRGSCDIRNLNVHSGSWVAIKAALTAGLYPNLARYSPVDGSLTIQHETRSQFHFTSTFLVQEGRYNGFRAAEPTLKENSAASYLASFQPSNKLLGGTRPMCPWVVFDDQQRAGQFAILHCSTAITPVTALLFAGNLATPIQTVEINQHEQEVIRNLWDETDYDSDDIDEEEIRQLCADLNYRHLSQEMVELNRSIRTKKQLSQPHKRYVVLRLDEFVGFVMDENHARLIMAMRQPLQSMLLQGIQDPARATIQGEEAIVNTALRVLSSEEMAMPLLQPSNTGQRPMNVSADSMLVEPKLNPGEAYQVKRYLSYTPPPKGYVLAASNPYTTTAELKSNVRFLAASKPEFQAVEGKLTEWKPFGPVGFTPSQSATALNPPTYSAPFPTPNGRPVFKSYSSQN